MNTMPEFQRWEYLHESVRSMLAAKGITYGDSWKKRGGVGAFMMMARKWDRIENMVQDGQKWDIFAHFQNCKEDIADLIAYLTLVYCEAGKNSDFPAERGEAEKSSLAAPHDDGQGWKRYHGDSA